jgi:hypothetical protein
MDATSAGVLDILNGGQGHKSSITSGCQNSWRKAAFQCTVTYGIFVK